MKIDILDRLQEEDGFVRMVLASGKILFCKPKCIVYDEDCDGWETDKQIMVEPFGFENMMYFREEDIQSYEVWEEKNIPPCE